MKRYTGVGGNVPDKCVVYVDPYYPLTAGDSVDEDERDRVSGYVCTDELSDYEWTPNMFQTKKAQENGGFTLRMVSNGMSYNDDSAWGVDWCVYFPLGLQCQFMLRVADGELGPCV